MIGMAMQARSHTTLIAREEFERHLQDPDWVIFDCRFDLTNPGAGENAYRKSHIVNAQYAHLERDLSSPKTATTGRHPLPDPEQLAEKLAAWGVGEGKQVVAYDDANGAIAARLWWLLQWLGHRNVAVLDGGFNRWCDEGRPISAELPSIEPARFVARPQFSAYVDSDFVARNLVEREAIIVDARAQSRFVGEVEPIDLAAGHIPGARNRPFKANLDARGDFLPAAALKTAFRELLSDVPAQRVVHMCGSGVTACHNILAMEIAGLAGSRLYAGSWSEWITDAKRPRITHVAD
jgi:thiosulfate/3-mercaptopyruvate sulfurtransferase